MALETGKYMSRYDKTVTVWKSPDADGDGDDVWIDQKDHQGQIIGRKPLLDEKGEPVRHYEPPEGFENRPSFDHTDNYVRVDQRGRIVRDKEGKAISIKPGHALVEYPDGTSELLAGEYEQYQFELAHDRVDDSQTSKPKAKVSSKVEGTPKTDSSSSGGK